LEKGSTFIKEKKVLRVEKRKITNQGKEEKRSIGVLKILQRGDVRGGGGNVGRRKGAISTSL